MDTELITPENIETYLVQHQQKELLRFVAVGSVDDGKSTLIGRLLHDTHGVYEDQLSAVKRATSQRGASEGEEIDFSLFTDGLKAEREQGITIDVAYRYFSTEKRKFIIADTPGHVQYTRNMATGASTANVGIILIDARLGVLQQSRRHAYIASLLGIPRLLVAVNKMDLRDYDQSVFDAIVKEFSAFAARLSFKDVGFIPISAKLGDNVVHESARTPWYQGGTLLQYLENVPVALDRNFDKFRFPVQNVIRPNLDYRGFAGEIASGILKAGDSIMVLPSRKTSVVEGIDTFEGSLAEAPPSTAVTVRLRDEIDISRGDMLVHSGSLPMVGRSVRAHVVWMSEKPLDPEKSYLMKHTTQMVRVNIDQVESVKDLESLQDRAAQTLNLNDIGLLRLTTHRPLFFDPYAENRATGAFVLIDSITNNTVAGGMLVGLASSTGAGGEEADAPTTEGSQVSPRERVEVMGQRGTLIALHTNLQDLDARAFAHRVERVLYDRGRVASVLNPSEQDGSTLTALLSELVRLGVIAIVPCSAELPSLKTVADAYGGATVVHVSVGPDGARIGDRDLSGNVGDWESLAGKVVDDLAATGRLVD